MADLKEKTYVEDVDRSVYDIRDAENDAYRMESGLTPEIVEKLSKEKDDPVWMQQFRLESLQIYNEMKIPNWGPSIEGLDMDHIATYVRPNTKMRNDWKDVPEDIKETFERLGIPQAERKSLAGVGAQYDSELVYHNVKDSVAAEGVVYTDMESAIKGEYADMVRKYFMKLVTPHDHKFAALHGAVWSGGSFVYVPKGVHLSIPLQSYFRLNAKGAGQFEHTLIIVDEGASLHFIEGCSAPKYNVANLHAGCVELYVKKGAKLRYSTIENWSKNMYNLNTKRALVEEGGTIEWISGSFGSHVGCLYPMSILKGDNSRMEFTGVTFAGAGQNLDTGAKVVHVGKNTSSYMNTRSISKSGGISTFRSSVVVEKGAKGAKSAVSCQSLMLDSESRSDTIPAMDIRTKDAAIGHEAKIGAISNEAVFYLMSRGMSEEDARAMIVSGFADNVSKELPVEDAVEMNNLIRLEMKGSLAERSLDMNDTILINRLPTRTWNRLGVNETAIAWGQADDLGEEKITAAGQTERLEITGSGERGEKMVDIHVPAGQTVTVFETLRAEKGLLVRTALHVEKDAKVRLVQIQNAAQDSLLRLETSGECAENGQVELIQVLLGRGDVYSDGQFELNGNGAGFTAGIGYLGQKHQTVDMNLVVNHWGQKTTSEINAAGALKDDAQKIFRGTIDFKKGSAGSVGSEQETVLMLGDGVVNKTVPLILCAEENVVGNHGATIGELDEDTLFYFESRGISAAEAENIMARAAIERLARTIEDEAAQAAILSELEEVL